MKDQLQSARQEEQEEIDLSAGAEHASFWLFLASAVVCVQFQ